MKNTKVLELLNDGKIEELKKLLQNEIYTESLKGNGNAKKRYSAMRKYFTYTKSENPALQKPCMIDYNGENYTSFVNSYSLAITKEKAEGIIHHFGDYFDIGKMINFNNTMRKIDFGKVIAEAKSQGYKLKKSEVDINCGFKYVMYYDGAYYKIGLLDATYGIIDNGGEVEVYHFKGKRTEPICIKNDIGIAVVLPINFHEDDFKNKGKIIIRVEDQ